MTWLITRMAIVFFPLVILGGLIWPVAAFSAPGVQSTGNNVTSDLTEGGSISGHVFTDDGNTPYLRSIRHGFTGATYDAYTSADYDNRNPHTYNTTNDGHYDNRSPHTHSTTNDDDSDTNINDIGGIEPRTASS